ncbi:hypothetical protein BJ138DRAFT_1168122 [Hygrophoropsis aurantiaca]|uniref:Uncharacterized protein n=1 Tax=Hygrophoropsis aurantiaca TaxID=72124 RepID=A0ACB7ZRR9_9AGAM|nr:hypothetical protein BJ138DRAFT_1168122 [Hygrophoropsis aurantiaca]
METKLEPYDCLIPYRTLLWISMHDRNCSLEHAYQLDIFNSYVNIYLVVNWTSNIFLLSMQAILLIRIYALFNRSKKVLVFLATLYVIQVTIVFVAVGLLLNNRATHQYLVSISPAYGSVTQVATSNTPAFLAEAHASTILSAVCDVILLFFALWAFVRHAREAKTLHGGWSINVLVRTMVTDHLLYYVCYVVWLSLALATNYITNLTASSALLTDVLDFCNALAVVAGPRMVISLRSMENKTRGEGETMDVELSTIRFDIQEPPTKSESVMQEAGF